MLQARKPAKQEKPELESHKVDVSDKEVRSCFATSDGSSCVVGILVLCMNRERLYNCFLLGKTGPHISHMLCSRIRKTREQICSGW